LGYSFKVGAHNQSFEQTPEREAALREWASGGAAQFNRYVRKTSVRVK